MDNLIVIHNERLLSLFQGDTSMEDALRMADDAVMLGVLSVAELVNLPGEINVDLADVKAIMKIPGRAMMAIGEGHGKGGPLQAAKQAVNNPCSTSRWRAPRVCSSRDGWSHHDLGRGQ